MPIYLDYAYLKLICIASIFHQNWTIVERQYLVRNIKEMGIVMSSRTINQPSITHIPITRPLR